MPSDTPHPPSVSTPGPSIEVITDGVISAYIHEISQRHRGPAAAGNGPAAR